MPSPGADVERQRAAELANGALHHLHPDAAAGRAVRRIPGGEAGQRRAVRAARAPRAGRRRHGNADRPGPLPHRRDVDAAAVVGDLERDHDRRRWRRSASGGRPRASRPRAALRPDSMPWLTALRTRCSTGSIIRSTRYLSISVSCPQIWRSTCASGFAGQIAHDERHALEDLADPDEPHAHDPFAQVAQLALDRVAVLLDARATRPAAPGASTRDNDSPSRARVMTRSPIMRINSSRRREVDADEVRRGERRRRAAPRARRLRAHPALARAAIARRRDAVLGPLVENTLGSLTSSPRELEPDRARRRPIFGAASTMPADLLQPGPHPVDRDAARRQRGRRVEYDHARPLSPATVAAPRSEACGAGRSTGSRRRRQRFELRQRRADRRPAAGRRAGPRSPARAATCR